MSACQLVSHGHIAVLLYARAGKDMPSKGGELAAAYLDGIVYVISGRSVYMYSVKLDSWSLNAARTPLSGNHVRGELPEC